MKQFLLVLLLGISMSVFSQKQVSNVEQVWLGYLNQTRLTNKFGIWTDLHLRTKEDFVDNLSTSIVRLGLTYYVTNNTKLTAGYAFVNHFPADNHTNVSQPEHRPWQQIQWHNNHPRIRVMQWIRLEERYRRRIKNNDELGEGYGFNWKTRYNLLVMLPLSKNAFAPKSLSFVANDEVHVNFGKQIVYNYFDQNRFFVGLAYHVNAHDNLQFGYMNLFQQLAAGNQYRNVNAARVFYFHNLDLRKKQAK